MPDLLARITTFVSETYFNAAQIDAEFDQLVNLVSGVSTDKRIYTRFSDGTLPVLRIDQLGAGTLLELLQNGVAKITINNNGQIVSTLATGTAPITVASTTLCTNLNAATVDGYGPSGFLRDDTADQSIISSFTFLKNSTGDSLKAVLDANLLTIERVSDAADIFTLSAIGSATRVLAFPSTTQVQSAYTPTASNDVARLTDISERNTFSIGGYIAAPAANNYFFGWFCPETGITATKIKAVFRSGAPGGTTTLRLLKNDTTNLGELELAMGATANQVYTTDIADAELTADDHLSIKVIADGGHNDLTASCYLDNSE